MENVLKELLETSEQLTEAKIAYETAKTNWEMYLKLHPPTEEERKQLDEKWKGWQRTIPTRMSTLMYGPKRDRQEIKNEIF